MKKLLVAAVFAAGLCGVGFVLSACDSDSGKEAWLYTDLGKEEFESLRKKCYEGYKNLEDIDFDVFGVMNKEAESACEQFASIALENDNFCERFINNEPKRKINKKDYFLAAGCYYDNKTGDKADNEKQALEYLQKACENKDFVACYYAGKFYYTSDKKSKESLSVWKKGLGYYDKACELGAKFACKMGLKQTLQKLKANLNETKKACEDGDVLMCEILKEL